MDVTAVGQAVATPVGAPPAPIAHWTVDAVARHGEAGGSDGALPPRAIEQPRRALSLVLVALLHGVAAAMAVATALLVVAWTGRAGDGLAMSLRPAVCAAAAAVAILGAVGHRRAQHAAAALRAACTRAELAEHDARAARRAGVEKSRFVAIASHDLRQPVHALGLFTATLQTQLQGTSSEPLMRNVLRAVDGLQRLLSAMLDVSRLDAGTVDVDLQAFALRDVFRRLHMQFAGQAELAGFTLRFSSGGKTVTSDAQLLERILGNLIQNALKNTVRGGVVVVARTTPTHTHIEVWDTGRGIAPDELPRIFDEFYQVGRDARDRALGLGMGLAIVSRLVRALGHGLSVSSRLGSGTVFRLAIARGGAAAFDDIPTAADTLPGPLPLPRSVLVVEDEAAIRDGMRQLLEEWGYRVSLASCIAELPAAVQASHGEVDLILCDLHLGDASGGADGIAAIDAARRCCGQQVPAVLITGDTSPFEMRRIAASGHRVLFKPVQSRKLYDVLRGIAPTA